MAKDEYKLKFVIDADGTTAKQALASLTGDINKLGGSVTATFGGLVPIAGAAGAAILGIGSALTSVGVAMYDLTKKASEFGSIIHDASIKTGLGAETISALKLAADQSGTSLEQMTGGIAKFSKVVGAAGDGSEEAAKKLKSLGIDPKDALNDLDGSLAKVFKRIGDAKPGIEQITLAQKAFGKAGADLIPLMEQVGYNFDDFKKKAKELGVTITDEDAKAADDFGDQMVLLDAQLAGVGRTIGTALMPQFTALATSISEWLAQNKGEITEYAGRIAMVFGNIIRGFEAVKNWIETHGTTLRVAAGILTLGTSEAGILAGQQIGSYLEKATRPQAQNGPQDSAGYRAIIPSGDPDGGPAGKAKRPPKESDAQFRRFFDELGFRVVRTFGGAINDGSPHPYGGAADVSIRGKSADDVFRLIVKSLEKGYRVVDERVPVPGIRQTGPHVHVENAKTSLLKSSIIGSLGFSPDEVAYLKQLDAERLGKASGKGGFDAYRQKQTDEEKRAQDERVKLFEAAEKRKFEIGQSMTESLIALQQQEYESALKFGSSDEAYAAARNLHALKMSEIDDEIKAIEDRAARTVAGSEEEKQLVDEVTLKKIERDRLEMRSLDELDKRRQEIFDREMERDLKRLKNEQDIKKALEDETRERMMQAGMVPGYDRNGNPTAQAGQAQSPLGQQIDDLLGRMNAVVGMQTVLQQFGQIGVQVFEDMGQAVGGAIEQWAIYGGSIGQALRKALAAELAHVAGVATVNALYATALGFMRLAQWDFVGAGHAFVSAGMWAALAGGTALGARALGGGGKGSASASAASGGSYNGGVTEPTTPYSRASATAYYSGRDNTNTRLASALENFNRKVDSARPGDVFMKGMRQNPGAVGNQLVKDVQSDSGISRQFLTSSGFNTK